MKTIIINIPLEGISAGDRSVEVKAEGFTGSECVNATAPFEKAMGTTLAAAVTPEYYQQTQQHQQQRGES